MNAYDEKKQEFYYFFAEKIAINYLVGKTWISVIPEEAFQAIQAKRKLIDEAGERAIRVLASSAVEQYCKGDVNRLNSVISLLLVWNFDGLDELLRVG